jgi:hypothetical protein
MLGLDSILIYTSDFEVDLSPDSIRIDERGSNFLFTDVTGALHFGTKATVINGKILNYANPYIEHGKLWLPFSPADIKGNRKHNISTVSPEELKAIVTQMEKGLLESGIRVGLFQCKISRLDLFRDCFMDFLVTHYARILRELYVPYRKLTPFQSSHYWGNKQGCLAFYDKGEEAKAKGMELPPEFIGKHLLRIEHRLLHHPKVIRETGIDTVGALATPDSFELLNSLFTGYLKKIFHYADHSDLPTVTAMNDRDKIKFEIQTLEDVGVTRSATEYVLMVGINTLTNSHTQSVSGKITNTIPPLFPDYNSLLDFFTDNGLLSRDSANDRRKNHLRDILAFERVVSTGKPGLMTELIEKFIINWTN